MNKRTTDTFPSTDFTLQAALDFREGLRSDGRALVFTNGVFDLLHVGHLDYLEKARLLGGALIVGINADSGAGLLKGEGRPITPVYERARLVSALWPVDQVVIFDDRTADQVISSLQPEIYVKGGDYQNKELPERATVESYGGKVVLIDLVPDHSTTLLIRKIQDLPR